MLQKYIVITCTDKLGNVHELAIAFPHLLTHRTMRDAAMLSVRKSDCRYIDTVGAGFVHPSTGLYKTRCFGRSESLNIDSRESQDDAAFARSESMTSTIIGRK